MLKCIILSTALSLAIGGSAVADAFTDDLSRCFVVSASPNDQNILIKWTFAEFAMNPVVAPLSTVTVQEQSNLEKQASDLYIRLLTKDCRQQAVAALKYDGADSWRVGFGALGTLSQKWLLTDPAAKAGMIGLAHLIATNPDVRKVAIEANDKTTHQAPPVN